MMLSLFGLLGLVISVVGVDGVMAYIVSQRTREIAVARLSGLPSESHRHGAGECVRLGFRRARPGRNQRVVSRHDRSGLSLRHRVPRPEGISRRSCRSVRCRPGCERHSCAAGRARRSDGRSSRRVEASHRCRASEYPRATGDVTPSRRANWLTGQVFSDTIHTVSDRTRTDRFTSALYMELRRRAAVYVRRERRGHTLQPTAIVNEELRYFSGLSIDETAAAMDVSPATVDRKWRAARTWLQTQLSHGS